jgi:hypothetical protein
MKLSSLPIAMVVAAAVMAGGGTRAEAALRPDVPSIAGIRLGMTPRAVRNAKGQPQRLRVRTEVGWRLEYRYSHGLRIQFDPDTHTVETVITTNPRERSQDGVGVGSTLERARSYLGRSFCGESPDFGHFCAGRRNGFRSMVIFGFIGRRVRVVVIDVPRPTA